MAGIPSIDSRIALADSTGTAGWKGTNGIKAIVTDLSTQLLQRGVLVVGTPTELAALSFADANIVAVKNTALYVYNPSNTISASSNNLDVAASGGGKWEYLCDLGPQRYGEVIGNSAATAFTITHNLNTLDPTVVIRDLLASPNVLDTTGEVTVIDANTITVTYTGAPGTFQFNVTVKK